MKLTKSQRETVGKCFLLKDMTAEDRDRILDSLEAESFRGGETIYTPSEFKRALGIVAEGEVSVMNPGGAQLNVIPKGGCFGAAALFDESESDFAYVTTLIAHKACQVVFISDVQLQEWITRYPAMALNYIRFLSGRVRFLNRRIDSFTSPSSEEALIKYLKDVKFSFNSYTMNLPSIRIGTAAVEDDAYFQEITAKIAATRERTKKALAELGFEFPDSMTNFIFARHPKFEGADLQKKLRERGIVVRHFSKPEIDQYLRITIGTRQQMQTLFDALEEILYGQHAIRTNPDHYEAIAKKVSTSIPQIRRDFTSRFSNGKSYLELAGKRFDQPTFHARRIMELQDLYDDETLDRFIGMAIDEDKLDIKSFKTMLREYNAGERKMHKSDKAKIENADGAVARVQAELTRDCSYYEEYAKEVLNV